MSVGAGVTAGIVATGSELLAGRVRDANGPWIAERLGELGVDVVEIVLVGDRPEEMESALRSLAGVDLVVTSGGLGPTADDLTAAVVADLTGRPLELDEHMEKVVGDIIARFADRLRWDADALAEANRKQAMVPRGATPIPPVGTAPGLAVPPGDGYRPTVLVLPGPPREVRGMWDDAVASGPVQELLERTEPFVETHLRLFGVPESEITGTLRAAGERADLSALEVVTCLRDFALEVDLRRRPGDDAAAAAHDAVVAEIDARHGSAVFSRTGETIDEILFGLLRGHTIATAESCTGGLLAGRLTEPAGASAHVQGGIVSYSNAAKAHLLGVPQQVLDTDGAVSTRAVQAMARGAIDAFGVDVAVAISGIAGPGGGTDEKPVGYVCFCVRTADGAEIVRDPVLPGARGDVRERSVVLAMHLVRRILTTGDQVD
ncbi:competence/damage-inducible protein A [Actinomycetospora sp. OC33-EN08]|uniref:CinA-like protein n=1 Tax=Actinomycetospora aurantiaca TaxID=3129233 RepID=A0ABU8MMC0_9PSEU